MAIPRLQITSGFGELLGFLVDLIRPGNPERMAMIGALEAAFTARYDAVGTLSFCRARMAFYHVLRALDVPLGSEVIISAIHVADFVNMIRLAGLTPVVADLGEGGFLVERDRLAAMITPRTRVVLVTHLSGYAHDMAPLAQMLAERDIHLIEDCSQAFAAFSDTRRLGTFGTAAIFSLSLLKSVCTVMGGVAVVHDQALLDRLRHQTANLGRPARAVLAAEAIKHAIIKIAVWRPLFSALVFPLLRLLPGPDRFSGYQKHNKTVVLRARLPEIFLTRFSWQQARLGLRQWTSLESREARRRALGERLYETLSGQNGAGYRLPKRVHATGNTYWLFPILCDEPQRFKKALATQGIDSSPMLLSVLAREAEFQALGFASPNAEQAHDATLFVPMYPGLTDADLERVAAAVRHAS
jgi:perosamine synthetase